MGALRSIEEAPTVASNTAGSRNHCFLIIFTNYLDAVSPLEAPGFGIRLLAAPRYDEHVRRRSFLIGWIPGFFHRPTVELSGVQFRVIRYADSPRRFLVIHGDEDTARDVLTTYMVDHAGIAYIVTGKDRNVEIRGAKIISNWMFSREGAERSIRSLNPNLDPERLIDVLDYLDHEREKLVKRLIPPREW